MGNTLDKIINDEDKELLLKIIRIKKDLTDLIDRQDFINKMRETIKESDTFDFSSEVAEKFIDYELPIFKIKVKETTELFKLIDFKNKDDDDKKNRYLDLITEKIFNEIINEISNYIEGIMENDSKIQELMAEIDKENKNLRNFFMSNIYTVRIGASNNLIYLTYFK